MLRYVGLIANWELPKFVHYSTVKGAKNAMAAKKRNHFVRFVVHLPPPNKCGGMSCFCSNVGTCPRSDNELYLYASNTM